MSDEKMRETALAELERLAPNTADYGEIMPQHFILNTGNGIWEHCVGNPTDSYSVVFTINERLKPGHPQWVLVHRLLGLDKPPTYTIGEVEIPKGMTLFQMLEYMAQQRAFGDMASYHDAYWDHTLVAAEALKLYNEENKFIPSIDLKKEDIPGVEPGMQKYTETYPDGYVMVSFSPDESYWHGQTSIYDKNGDEVAIFDAQLVPKAIIRQFLSQTIQFFQHVQQYPLRQNGTHNPRQPVPLLHDVAKLREEWGSRIRNAQSDEEKRALERALRWLLELNKPNR